MNKSTKGLPKFRSERDEAVFWETHDSSDYLTELEDDSETVFARPETGVIEVAGATWARLVREAQRRRTTPTALVRRWLKEKLASAR